MRGFKCNNLCLNKCDLILNRNMQLLTIGIWYWVNKNYLEILWCIILIFQNIQNVYVEISGEIFSLIWSINIFYLKTGPFHQLNSVQLEVVWALVVLKKPALIVLDFFFQSYWDFVSMRIVIFFWSSFRNFTPLFLIVQKKTYKKDV